ncbi:MAG: transposase [Syntrophobacteria bacterium]
MKGIAGKVENPFGEVKATAIVGTEEFIGWVKEQLLDVREWPRKDYPHIKTLQKTIPVEEIAEIVAQDYGVEPQEIVKARSPWREARQVLIEMSYRLHVTKKSLHLKKIIAYQIDLMAKHCSVPEVDLLNSFIGIKDYSAIGLILEIQTVERFLSVKKLASFFGLHPAYKVSGDGVGRRKILFMVTLTAIRSNPLIRSIYLEHIQKGMEKMAAIGLCMHKILRIIYGMLKHNMVFDPEIDRKNREKSYQSRTRANKDKNHRYQDFDAKAPISRRQNSKRKEQKQSHSDNLTKSGIIASAPTITLTDIGDCV